MNTRRGMSANSTRRKFSAAVSVASHRACPRARRGETFLAGGAAAFGPGDAGGHRTGSRRRAAELTPARPLDRRASPFHPQFHVDSMMAPGRRAGRPAEVVAGPIARGHGQSGIATVDPAPIAQPGIWYGNNVEESRTLRASSTNTSAKMGRTIPAASVSLPALRRQTWTAVSGRSNTAFDTLKADGIGLLTSYQDKYLGDPSRRRSMRNSTGARRVIYVHPTTPDCCRGSSLASRRGRSNTQPIPPARSRTWSSAARRMKFPDIRWIFSHSGGTLPFLSGRFVPARRGAQAGEPARMVRCRVQEVSLRARAGQYPGQIAALLKMVPIIARSCTGRTFHSAMARK